MRRGVRAKIMKSEISEFEKKVLLEVYKVPRGKTITYGELAKRVGRPKAIRAVANALKKNPLPILIPCHRIVAKNGLGGYSGGTEIKRHLIEGEMKTRRRTRHLAG
ncbi:MAG: MGMT family protein [Candidatus Micrarchaeota archaeon]